MHREDISSLYITIAETDNVLYACKNRSRRVFYSWPSITKKICSLFCDNFPKINNFLLLMNEKVLRKLGI